jgi:hypothetical protein
MRRLGYITFLAILPLSASGCVGLAAPLFLIGMSAAGIPLVLHMIHHKKSPEILFPSLRFIRVSNIRTARRKRIEDLLLLLLRMGILILLSLALARPVSRAAGIARSGDSTVIVVVDNSLSMRTRNNQKTCYDLARSAAQDVLRATGPDALVALRFTAGPPPGLADRAAALARPGANRSEIDEVLLHSTPSFRAGDTGRAVIDAIAAAAAADRPDRQIIVVSDFQAAGFTVDPEAVRKAKVDGASIVLVNCGGGTPQNLAITSVQALATAPTIRSPVNVMAHVKNFSNSPRQTRVSFFVGNDANPYQAETISLAPGEDAGVSFPYTADRPGTVTARVQLEPDDLEEDDVRYVVMDFKPALDALVVGADDEPSMKYIENALDPLGAGETRIRPRRARSLKDAPPLEAFRAVFLAGAARVDGSALREYVKAGGRLVIFPGPATDPAGLAEDFGRGAEGLLPAEVLGWAGRIGDPSAATPVNRIDFEHDAMLPYKDSPNTRFTVIRAMRRLNAEVRHASGGREVLGLEDGGLLLAVKEIGRGRVYLFGTSPDPAWSNLASASNFTAFAPLLHSILLVGASGAGDDSFRPGEIIHPDFGPRDKPFSFEVPDLTGRGGQPQVRQYDPASHKPPDAGMAETPGIFPITTAPQGTVFAVVNIDPVESDPKPLTEAELRAAFPAPSVTVAAPENAVEELGRVRRGIEWWDLLLTAALAAALVESFFANRLRPAGEAPPSAVRDSGQS